jgi:hypothetical protein
MSRLQVDICSYLFSHRDNSDGFVEPGNLGFSEDIQHKALGDHDGHIKSITTNNKQINP